MPAGFDRSTVNRVQQSNDIIDVISEHVSLVKKGREMVGLCPFHDDHRPSMYVNPEKQIYKCFACGAGGDVIKFLQVRENLSFPQAVERLAERAGIQIKAVRKSEQKGTEQFPEVDPNKLAKANEWACNIFQQNLGARQGGKFARDYLKARKLSVGAISTFRIGLAGVNNDLLRKAENQKASIEVLSGAGLVLRSGSDFIDKFVNRLIFPIIDVTGRVIGFGGRMLDEKGPKYLNSPTTVLFDKSNCLYGLDQARKAIVESETAVVVEGYTDCIMAHQFGVKNVVATLGTSFTEGHARILRRYAKKVILIYDSDTAGVEAASRALEVCLTQRLGIKIASVPEGKDPCDFLVTAGKDKFEGLMRSATDVFEFKWGRLIQQFGDGDNLVDRKAAVEEFLQAVTTAVIAGNLSLIEKGLIVNRLSQIIGIESKEINAELGRKVSQVRRRQSYSKKTGVKKEGTASASVSRLAETTEREILEVLLNEPKLLAEVTQKITAGDFDVPIFGQIAGILFAVLEKDPEASLSAILSEVESAELGSRIVELAQTGEKKGNFQKRLEDALAVMHRPGRQRIAELSVKGNGEELLRNISENTPKQNPHNIGLI